MPASRRPCVSSISSRKPTSAVLVLHHLVHPVLPFAFRFLPFREARCMFSLPVFYASCMLPFVWCASSFIYALPDFIVL